MLDKGFVHHKDGNALNNEPSNWQVLCSFCLSEKHPNPRKRTNNLGYYIAVLFTPWLRKQIFEKAGYRCQECGDEVIDYSEYKRGFKHRCQWCKNIVPKDAIVKWQSGEIMCKVCFNRWQKSKSL